MSVPPRQNNAGGGGRKAVQPTTIEYVLPPASLIGGNRAVKQLKLHGAGFAADDDDRLGRRLRGPSDPLNLHPPKCTARSELGRQDTEPGCVSAFTALLLAQTRCQDRLACPIFIEYCVLHGLS